MNNTDPTKTPG